MGGMPMLEVKHWLHEVNGLYLTLIPCFIWLNNFVGPKALEPVFAKDYLMSQFEKIAEVPAESAKAATSSAPKASFTPTPGKAPVLPKNMFARRMGNPRLQAITLASTGLLALVKPVASPKSQ